MKQPRVPEYREGENVRAYIRPLILFLKDFATAPSDIYYRGSGDHIVHLFADPQDGIYRTSRANLVSYSYDMGCVDVALQMLPHFVGDEFAVPQNVYSVWCEDNTIYYNDAQVRFHSILKSEDISYQAVLKK